jgi:hypothetical protein
VATTSLSNNFRRDLFNKVIDIPNDTLKFALYNGSSHDQNTGAYTTVNEASGTGYTAGGATASGATQATDTTNNVSYYDFNDVSWATSTITATDVLLYDDTVASPTANVSIYVGDFGGSRSTSAGTFQLTLPSANYNTALLRIA